MTASPAPTRKKARGLRALRDVFLLVAAFALLGAQALSTLHFVLVPHHLCALHGVLEDGAHGATAANQAANDARSHDTATSDARDQDAHDVCSVATRPGHTPMPARPALERAPIAEVHVAVVTFGASVKADRAALLSSAPKTSPPVRG